MIIKWDRKKKYKLILALFVAIIFEFSFFLVVNAETITGSGGNAGVEFIDFNCGDSTCRSNQNYLSRSENLSIGDSFNKLQITASTTQSSIKVSAYVFEDTGLSRTSCNDNSCVTDDTLLLELFSGDSASKIFGQNNVFEFSFNDVTIPENAVSPYLLILIDPNTPYQTIEIPLSVDGTKESGLNTNRTENGYKYQLCLDNCDIFGSYIPPQYTVSEYSQTYQTRFINLDLSGTSTALLFDIDYFLDSTEYNQTTEPNSIIVTTVKDGIFSDEIINISKQLIASYTTTYGDVQIIPNYNFSDGSYYSYVQFYNIETSNIVFPETKIDVEFEIDNGLISEIKTLSVFTGGTLSEFESQTCSLTNISGCIENSMRYLFLPSDTAIKRFTENWQDLRNYPPFGYLTSGLDALSNISTTTATSSWSFGNIPFVNSIFDPFKLALIPLLWGIYGIFFYKRIREIDL